MEPLDSSISKESSQELIQALLDLCPLFKKHWRKVESFLQRADGSYTPCSILSEFARYLDQSWDRDSFFG